MDEMLKVIDDICKGVNDFIADYKKQRMLSPFNESLDNFKYNRINLLRDLDEYIDSLGCH